MKYLFIGLGHMGLRHLQNLRSLTDDPIYALRTTIDKELDKKYNITSMDSLQSALDLKPNVVFITNPTSKHLQYALMFCDSHLFIEKPISINSEGIDLLLKTMVGTDKICFVGYNYRFHHTLLDIKQKVEEGKVGKIYYARFELAQYLPDWHKNEDYRKSYASQKDLGGGALLTLAHDIDLAYWLFGKVKTSFALKKKVSSLEIDVEDIVSIILEMENGTIVEIHLDYLQKKANHSIKIVGSKNELVCNIQEDYDLRDLSYMYELKHFLNCIKGKEKPKMTNFDIFYVMQLIDSLNLSAKEGCRMEYEI